VVDCVIKNKIRELRFFADEMTQQQLAIHLGVTRQTVMAIEKGKYSPSLEVAFKIELTFDKSLHEVFAMLKFKEIIQVMTTCLNPFTLPLNLAF
jgi:putative transcriptional regulator